MMSQNIYFKFFLFSLFLAVSLGLSLGVITDWNILDHLAMVDRWRSGFSLYSELTDFPSMASSVYFPGVAYLTHIIMFVIPDNLIIEFMHLVSLLTLIWLILIQYKITKDLVKKFSGFEFFAFWIFFTVVILSNWYLYALKFKPDTLAITCGLTALYFTKIVIEKKYNWPLLIGLSILIGIPLLLKQQYIAFIFGYVIFASIQKDLRYFVSAMVVSIVALMIVLHIRYLDLSLIHISEPTRPY